MTYKNLKFAFLSLLDFKLHETLYLHIRNAQAIFVLEISESKPSLMPCHGKGSYARKQSMTVSDMKHWNERQIGEGSFHGGL